ncbi:MAG: VWA domain-containing protein [Myxococcales bacterium]
MLHHAFWSCNVCSLTRLTNGVLLPSALAVLVSCGGPDKPPGRSGGLSGEVDDGGKTGSGDGDGSGDDGSGDGDRTGDDAPGQGDGEGPGTCARAELDVQRVIPTVWLLVDGSGSMAAPLAAGGASRWSLLRDALVAQSGGLVSKLQESVAFGLYVYDGGLSAPGVYVPGVCPRAIEVAPTLNNAGAIATAYPANQTGASTPTHYALIELSNRIKASKPSAQQGPAYVVLATDGKPNLCDFHDGVPATEATDMQAVATVTDLAKQGIKTFAISLAGNDADVAAHLEDVAKAGATGEKAFRPEDKNGLVAALTKIIGGTVSCDVKLEGTIVAGRECAGEVSLNGKALECNGNDGYEVEADLQTLRLVGKACDELRQNPKVTLNASFACEDVVIL